MNKLLASISIASILFATPVLSRTFECEGKTFDGDLLVFSGEFDRSGPIGNLTILKFDRYGYADGDYVFHPGEWVINSSNTFWTVSAFYQGDALTIRHRERTENQTFILLSVYPDLVHEFERASCYFYGRM